MVLEFGLDTAGSLHHGGVRFPLHFYGFHEGYELAQLTHDVVELIVSHKVILRILEQLVEGRLKL